MALLARGSVTDRPWGLTFGALGVRGVTGELSVVSDGKTYKVAFDGGAVVGAHSPLASDAAVRLALTGNLITSTQVADITRRMAASPDRDEVDLLAELARLAPDHAQRLRRRLVAQRAARAFALERGDFVVDDQITIPIVPGSELDIRAICYLGAKSNFSEERMGDELAQLGGWFQLKPEATADLAQYGFTEEEKPALQMLLDGAAVADIEAANRSLGTRGVRAVTYALVSCGACEMKQAAPRPQQPRPRSASSAGIPVPGMGGGSSASINVARSRTTSSGTALTDDGTATPRAHAASSAGIAVPRAQTPSSSPGIPRTMSGSQSSGSARPGSGGTAQPGSGAVRQGTFPPGATAPGTGTLPPGATAPRPPTLQPGATAPRPPTLQPGATAPRPPTLQPGATAPRPPTLQPGATAPRSGTSPPPREGTLPLGTTAPRTRTPSLPPGIASQSGAFSVPRTRTGNTGTVLGPGGVRMRNPTGQPPMSTAALPDRGRRTSSPPPMRSRAKRNTNATAEIEHLLNNKLPMLDNGTDYYTLLGLKSTSSVDEIRQTYFMLARKLHPDRLAAIGIDDSGRDAQRLMAQINAAFAVLNDPIKRSEYTSILSRGGEAAVRAEDAKADETAMKIMRAEEAFRQGEMALRREQIPQALAAFQNAVDLQPNESEYQAMLAWTMFAAASDKQKVAIQTRKALIRAAEANDQSPTARFFLGRVERMLGREREALAQFHEVLRIKPNHTDAASEARVLEQRLKGKR